MEFKPASLAELNKQFGGILEPIGSEPAPADSIVLEGFAPITNALGHHLSFLSNSKFKSDLISTLSRCVLVRESHLKDLKDLAINNKNVDYLWAVKDPYLAYAKIQQWWFEASQPKISPSIHPSAVVHESAQVSSSATISANAIIEANAIIGDNVLIGAGTYVGAGTSIGEYSRIYPNATVYHECVIGKYCIIHSGVVIGADGFGFANEEGTWVKIPQTGRVVLSDHVEVGANTTIDRGALEDTLIGFGVKLDNQIMIAHNVTIGEHTAVAGCVGMAGSTRIGARCTIGGAAMLLGHLSLPDGTHITGASAVMSSIKESGAYSGIFPLEKHKSWEKTAATIKQLTELRHRIRTIEKKINQ